MEKIQVKITDIRFESEDGYQIAIGLPSDAIKKIAVKGNMHLTKDQSYDLEGEFREDYNRDEEFFLVKSYSPVKITDIEGIINYLSSSMFEGIGRRTARKIIEVGGEDTLNLLAEDPTYFIDHGINEKTIYDINKVINKVDLFQQLKKLTLQVDMSEFAFNEVYKYFKSNEIDGEELLKTPFKYVTEINGLTFRKADDLYALKNNNKMDNERIICGIETLIEDTCFRDGDSMCDIQTICAKAHKYLELPYDFDFVTWLNLAIENKKFYVVGDYIQTRYFRKIEHGLANNVLRRLDSFNIASPNEVLNPMIDVMQDKFKINYSETQRKAIIEGVNAKLSIITGGPGTGKTTVVNAIVNIIEDLKYSYSDVKDISEKIMLCAPTGRAAQRMYETTGYKAKTIHSLLIWNPGPNTFVHDFDNPLPQDFFVIDEFSMVDMFLAHSLFRAIKPSAKILIVGDKNQLESVTCGSVLHDLLECKRVPRIELDQIYRQGKDSSIPKLANIIQQNEKITFEKTDDIGYINTNVQLVEKIKQVVDKAKLAVDENGNTMFKEGDIQILYPKYGGISGIDNINAYLKPVSQNRGIEVERNNQKVLFQEGDRVMQLKNDYNNDIYNGDIGYIKVINNENAKGREIAMQVKFPGENDKADKFVNLTREDLINVTHAYAISIHKSQGSEFPVVILPITRDSINMVTKKLIYTAVTRAKKKLIIIGDIDCINEAVKHSDRVRNTNLDNLLNN